MLKQIMIMVLVLGLAVPALAGSGRISGVVADENGRPVAGARVEVHRDISKYKLTTFTTDSGEYAFNDVPPGIYLVQVTLKGVFIGEQETEFMLPVDRKVDLTVDAALVNSVIE